MQDVNPSFKLAVLVVQNCADKLAPFVWDFLTSSRHRASCKISYRDIILELAQCAPQMLDPAIPKLTQELMVGLQVVTAGYHEYAVHFVSIPVFTYLVLLTD